MALHSSWALWLAGLVAAAILASVLAALPVGVRLRLAGDGGAADGDPPRPLHWTLVVSVLGLALVRREGLLPGAAGADAPSGGATAAGRGSPAPHGHPGAEPRGRRRGSRLLAGLRPATVSFRAVVRLGRRVRVQRLDVAAQLGTGDAAWTALACGAAWGVLGGAVAALGAWARLACTPRIMVSPVFGRSIWGLRADCIVTVRLGQITVAALRVVAALRRGRTGRPASPAGGSGRPWSRILAGGGTR